MSPQEAIEAIKFALAESKKCACGEEADEGSDQCHPCRVETALYDEGDRRADEVQS